MTIDTNTGLVLEGGGLRGVFTCGVLDCFMDHGVRCPLKPIKVGRMEKDTAKLTELYDEGYDIAEKLIKEQY